MLLTYLLLALANLLILDTVRCHTIPAATGVYSTNHWDKRVDVPSTHAGVAVPEYYRKAQAAGVESLDQLHHGQTGLHDAQIRYSQRLAWFNAASQGHWAMNTVSARLRMTEPWLSLFDLVATYPIGQSISWAYKVNGHGTVPFGTVFSLQGGMLSSLAVMPLFDRSLPHMTLHNFWAKSKNPTDQRPAVGVMMITAIEDDQENNISMPPEIIERHPGRQPSKAPMLPHLSFLLASTTWKATGQPPGPERAAGWHFAPEIPDFIVFTTVRRETYEIIKLAYTTSSTKPTSIPKFKRRTTFLPSDEHFEALIGTFEGSLVADMISNYFPGHTVATIDAWSQSSSLFAWRKSKHTYASAQVAVVFKMVPLS